MALLACSYAAMRIARANNTAQTIPFSQNWSNVGLITTNDDWSGVQGIEGYLGQDITTATGTDPQTLLGVSAVANDLDVIANQNSASITSGGVAEFDGIADPTIALQGSGTADAPYLLIYLNTTGQSNINISYKVRDIDATTDNAVQPVALQYRVGNSGNFTNVPAGFIADATTGPSLATLVTPVSVTLPAAVNNQPLVQVRIITSNAVGNDEWVGIDDISVTTGVAPPTVLAGTGAASPGAVIIGEAPLLTVTVTPGSNPISSGIMVTGDLSSIGGSSTQQFLDNGMNGDALAGDNIFSYRATIANGTALGGKTLPVAISDAQMRSANASVSLTVVTITPIHSIQGAGAASPLSGLVTTRGVVTGVKSNGFFIQEPDATVDANPNTSEGIFVFTSSAPPMAAAVGNLVQVIGTISEFVPSSDSLQPPLTELTSPAISLISTGNPLPAAITLTIADTPTNGTIEQLERFEGMRVRVDSLTVVAPTSGTVNEGNATATSNGVFYGVIMGIPRPFREPGIQANDPAPLGSIPPIPRFDANPERLRVDSDGLVGATAINVGAGAVVTNLVGPLDYGFRAYTILPEPAAPPTVTGGATVTAVTAPNADEFTVASYNLERFYDTVDDPSVSDVILATTAFNNRLNKASLGIRNFLRTPDVVGVVEVENLTTLQALATKINNDAVAASQPNPNYMPFLMEGNDIGGIDVGFLVKTAIVNGSIPRVKVNAVVQEGKTTTFTNPDMSTSLLNDRPSLRLDATINFAGGAAFPVTVIVNHLRSLSDVESTAPGTNGWATEGDRVRAKRLKQAEFLANLAQTRQTANPNERIILVGDFNAFEFNDGFVDSMNTIAGTPPPDNQTVVPGDGADLVTPNLSLLLDEASQRYSYVFDGNAQSLDHVLVNSAVISSTLARRVEHPRINADFPETARNDANSPTRLSDHDPVVSYYKIFLPITISGQVFNDLDGDGLKDAGEPGLQGVTIQLDLDADGGVDATTATDANGNYSFQNLGPGVYRIREVPPAGSAQTTANPPDIVAASGVNVPGVNFGNFSCSALTVNPTTIPSAFKDSPYSQTFTLLGGIGAITWSITGSVPTGLTFNPSTATLSGAPTVTRNFTFTIKASDSKGCKGERQYTLTTNTIGSGVVADPAVCLGPGATLAVQASVGNNSAAAQGTFSATLDPGLLALPGSCVANTGNCVVVNPSTVTWTGALDAGQTVTIDYRAQIADGTPPGTALCVTSTANINGGVVGVVKACATVNCQVLGPGTPAPSTSILSDQRAGSALIYNIYTSSAIAPNAQNTSVSVTNIEPSRPAYVHFFFVDGSTCSVADSYLCLTPNQTATFFASDLDPGTTGYIMAVAVDQNGCPVNFNYLIGGEYVKFASGHSANLGAEAVSAIAGALPLCNENSTLAQLSFDGVSYGALPRVLALDNVPSRADGNDTMLILNRIGGDLSATAAPLTHIYGIFYNDTETGVSFDFNPNSCQIRSSISNHFPRIPTRFEQFVPSGQSGWLKLYSTDDQGILGLAINFNINAAAKANAFNHGHNLHKLRLTLNVSLTIPVFPQGC
jgi:predicted extracellular nuclease